MAWPEKRTLKSGAIRWRGAYRDHEGHIRRKTFDRKSDALIWALGMEGVASDPEAVKRATLAKIEALKSQLVQIERGEMIIPGLDEPDERPALIFGDFAADYMARKTGSKATIKAYESALRRHILPTFADHPISMISYDMIELWYKAMPTGAANRNKIITMLSAIFNDAIKYSLRHPDKLALTVNPCIALALDVAEGTERVMVSKITEAAMIRDAKHDQLVHDSIVLGLELGVRRGECHGLSITSVNFDTRMVRVFQIVDDHGHPHRRTKDRRGRTEFKERSIPISSDRALRVLKSRVAEASLAGHDLLFLNEGGTPLYFKAWSARWNPIRDQHGLTSFHDLRHTFLTRLFEDGAASAHVQELAGHASLRTTELYKHSKISLADLEELRDMIRARQAAV